MVCAYCPMISHNVMINLLSNVRWQIWQKATTSVFTSYQAFIGVLVLD